MFFNQRVELFITGDHIMDGSTVVIGPPDGNMSRYIDSLNKLFKYKIDYFAPGHGNFMHHPKKDY
jgi:glyoxylase-like metal-dependent hydrolase (beta-lactamase superfamily II)